MTDWLLKRLVVADTDTTLWSVIKHLIQCHAMALLDDKTDRMPVVETQVDGVWYIICRKEDWIERFGE